jgi:uncharacterized paraquat-inducible protein A
MPDVFLLAAFVGYYRMINLDAAHVAIGMSGLCFIAAGLLSMISRATLDRRTVWRVLGPETHVPPMPRRCPAPAVILPCRCPAQASAAHAAAPHSARASATLYREPRRSSPRRWFFHSGESPADERL